jgi:hypothetical protein
MAWAWGYTSLNARAAGLGGFGDKSHHPAGIALTAGVPQLLALDARVTALAHFEFGIGYGAFPINSLANSIYQYQPTPVDLGTSDRFNLYPSGTYALSGVFAFARFFPSNNGGFFVHESNHSVNFSADISGSIKNETTGGVTNGALTGGVDINQPLLMVGPGWQFLIGDHFNLDISLAALIFLPATSNTQIGGSLAGFAALNSGAQTSYDQARTSITQSVNEAMAKYQESVKILPTAYLSIGYLF